VNGLPGTCLNFLNFSLFILVSTIFSLSCTVLLRSWEDFTCLEGFSCFCHLFFFLPPFFGVSAILDALLEGSFLPACGSACCLLLGLTFGLLHSAWSSFLEEISAASAISAALGERFYTLDVLHHILPHFCWACLPRFLGLTWVPASATRILEDTSLCSAFGRRLEGGGSTHLRRFTQILLEFLGLSFSLTSAFSLHFLLHFSGDFLSGEFSFQALEFHLGCISLCHSQGLTVGLEEEEVPACTSCFLGALCLDTTFFLGLHTLYSGSLEFSTGIFCLI